jgi:hypothetical protein
MTLKIMNDYAPSEFFRFTSKLRGYVFYDSKMERIYNYELFLLGLTPKQVFSKFYFVKR